MAQWNDFINLFPELEQPVIQELKNKLVSDFEYTDYNSFEAEFDRLATIEFVDNEVSEGFFQRMSSWLRDEASSIGEWEEYRTRFNSNDLPYINLIIETFEANSLAAFTELEEGVRAAQIKEIEGFWEAYIQTLASYINDLHQVLTISNQPISSEIDWNSDYELTVDAVGIGELTYQWRKNGVPIQGATAASYTLQEVRTTHSGQFDCIVSDSLGERISSKATITVVSFSSEIFLVRGMVQNENEEPITNLTVKTIDRKPGVSKVLGSTTTSGSGEYLIEYLKSELLDQESKKPNIIVQLFEEGSSEAKVTSDLIELAESELEINFTTNVFITSETEYSKVDSYVQNELEENVNLSDLDSEDVDLLVNKAFSKQMVEAYINANSLSDIISAVSLEQFYGILRLGLPATAEALATLSDSDIVEALLAAVEQNIIDIIDEAGAQVIADNINGEGLGIILQSEINPFKVAFDKVSLTEEKKVSLIQEYLNDSTGSNDIFEESILTESDISSIKRVMALADLDSSNGEIVDVLDDKVGVSGEPTELVDLISYTIADWEGLIDDDQADLLSIPLRFDGADSDRKTAYAKELKNSVELKVPTKVLAYQMNADVTFDSTDFDQFFTNHPEFELGNEQIAIYLEANPLEAGDYVDVEVAQKNLEAAQRLYHLAPSTDRFDAIKPLLENNLTSASQIAAMGETDFVAAYGSNVGEKVAKDIFNNAAHLHGRVTHALISHTNTLSPFVLASGDTGITGSIPGIPDLETIFGSLDYCECTHCRSVYSPAAYLVDLLNFIDHDAKVFSDDDPPVEISSQNLKDELVTRRGEVEKLLLHCDNTNKPLPYIDIVNEILENYILVNHASPAGVAKYYQTEVDSETLRATPQNEEESVYDNTLKSAIHPVQLPFNLWFEQSKLYLKKSDVDLGELIASAPMSELTQTRQNAVSAASSLGISTDQLDIINGSVAHTAQVLYNVASLDDLVNPVSTFIEKAGVTYDELTEIIESKFVNPLKKVIYFPADGSCRLNAMTIGEPESWENPDPAIGFTEIELQRFNRFVRLKKLTGWSVKNLDLVINSLNGGALNDTAIINMYYISKLQGRYDISIEEMITWWSDFNIATYVDEALFDKLFQDTSVNNESSIIPPLKEMEDFTGHNFLETEIKPLVLGALNLSAFDLDVILNQGEVSNVADVENFSKLYRLASFTKTIGISVKEYYEKASILEHTAVNQTVAVNPKDTFDFIEAIDLLQSISFSEEEVDYLKNGENTHDLALVEQDITDFLADLRSDYQGLGIEFSEVAVDLDFETTTLVEEFLPDRATIDDVIEGTTSALAPEAENYFSNNFTGIVSSAEELNTFKSDLDSVSGTSEEQVVERKRLVYKFLQRFNHVNTDFKASIIEKLALFFDLSTELTAVLFSLNTSVSNVNFGQLLFDLEFLMNHDGINKSSYPEIFKSIRKAHKVGVIAKALNVSKEELDYLINELSDSYLAMIDLPVDGESDVTFEDLLPILSLRELDDKLFTGDTTLINFLDQQNDVNRVSLLASSTAWRESDISTLIGSEGFNFEATPAVYAEIDWIKKLARVIPLMKGAKLDADALVSLQLDNPNAQTSFALRNFLSSAYNKKQWLKIATEIHDKTREQKRDAMLAYLIANETEFTNSTDVYDYFLIDTQMSACQLTSRIKQSISAVQLFIQRIGLGFEGELFLNADKMEEWNWRKNYRVWEANRKVFLYPENYVLPEVRANRSQLYNDFEETLTQDEVDFEVTEKAYQKYLEGFRNIANLEVVQTVHNKVKDELHVFARSHSEPVQHYHRTLKNRSVWSAWELIPVDMKGGILPIIHKDKLLVCWMDEREKRDEPQNLQFNTNPDSNGNINGLPAPEKKIEVRLAWTVKIGGSWEPKRISKKHKVHVGENTDKLTLIPMVNEFEELFISFMETPNSFSTAVGPGSDLVFWNLKYYLDSFVDLNGKELLFVKGTYNNESNAKHHIKVPIWGPISNWAVKYSNLRRIFNFGRFSKMLGASSLGNSDSIRVWDNFEYEIDVPDAPYFPIKEQQLKLIDINKFKWVNSVEFITNSSIVNGNSDRITDTTLRVNTSPLLTNLGYSNNDVTLISDVSHLFPLLSEESFYKNQENLSPFFIRINNRTYIIFPSEVDANMAVTTEQNDYTIESTF